MQPKVVEFLQVLKERGKKLFILTNSPFPFVDGGMRFLFQVLSIECVRASFAAVNGT